MVKTLKWSLPLTISLFIIFLSIILTLNFKSLYYLEIDNLSIEQSTNIDKDEIIHNYNVLIDYLTHEKIQTLELPSFPMSKEGEIHFEEVKDIFMLVRKLTIILGIYNVLSLVLLYKKTFKFLKHAAILTLLVPSITLSLVALNFDKSFVIFHKIAFNNDYWIFDVASDPVITILPQDFFMHSFFLIIALIIIFALGLFALYKLFSKKLLMEGYNEL